MSSEMIHQCPFCKAECFEGSGFLDQVGGPQPTRTWTCSKGCGYKRWDALKPKDGVERAP